MRYFDLPDSVAEERRVPVADLIARDLPLEMRVWVRNKGFGWWPGRTKGRDREGTYFVQLAGSVPLFECHRGAFRCVGQAPRFSDRGVGGRHD